MRVEICKSKFHIFSEVEDIKIELHDFFSLLLTIQLRGWNLDKWKIKKVSNVSAPYLLVMETTCNNFPFSDKSVASTETSCFQR